MFNIVWSDSAVDFMKKLDRSISKQIYNKISDLEENPFRYVKKLVGGSSFKLRVGDYRIIMDINKNILQILIIKVGHRKNVYD